MSIKRIFTRLGVGAVALAVASAGIVVPAANASPAGDDIVISEVYGGGGNSGATLTNDFVELYNPTDVAIDVTGWSLAYFSAAGGKGGQHSLTGTVPAKGHFLVQEAAGNGGTEALPSPDATGSLALSGTAGRVALLDSSAEIDQLPAGSVAGTANLVDFVGFGAKAASFEGTAPAPAPSNTTSVARTDTGTDTDDNVADFTAGEPTPETSGASGGGSGDGGDAGALTPIAEIQGTGSDSPLVGEIVTTTGVVTGVYADGGFNGYYIQTSNTGGALDFTEHTASDAVYVFSPATVSKVAIGDAVEVTGTVSEYNGLTELSVAADGFVEKGTGEVEPATVAYPSTDAQRESIEGMVIEPQGDFTVSNTYSTNGYGTVGLASGSTPLITPTEIAAPGSDAYDDAVAENAARGVTLDDGASINYLSNANTSKPVPYLSLDHPVTVGAAVDFTAPVILDYRYDSWSFQPTLPLVGEEATQADRQPVSFEDARDDTPENVGGDLTVSSFNVLNYFTTTGDQLDGCEYYEDRAGNPITVKTGCDARGAANAENLQRQQDKIVAAITSLDTDVLSLEEIENSAKFGKDRDDALKTLVDALNAKAGEGTWASVASPAADALPALDEQDVIRNAFIYQPAKATPVGESVVLTGSAAFSNAREPLAQAFKPVGGTDADVTLVISNHFKSKGSGEGEDADQGDGQGASNHSRVEQARALVSFADEQKQRIGTERVLLVGDFNAYTQEDPITVLTDAGYVDQGSKTGEYSYSFDGQSGSLDHIFASAAADKAVTGADIWNINAGESVGLEYSRYNSNVKNLYAPDEYRSSDHDPVIVGLSNASSPTATINLLNVNDFHGRIAPEDPNTVAFAATVERLKAEGGAGSVLLSAGDNIGASLFASASQNDQPTIDVLNELGVQASAVGNHEFDRGFDDLTGRVIGPEDDPNAQFPYLGANVYEKGTQTPALDEYAIVDVNGVKVGVIGAVTQQTASLVSPGGIASIDFGDPVDAVNRVADQLKDGDPNNGEADVIVAEYHEGATAGEGSNLSAEVARNNAFTKIVQETSPKVSVLFTAHTHQLYSWDAPIPGATDGATRPVIQAQSYGAFVGQVQLTVDTSTDSVTAYTARNVPTDELDEQGIADAVATYPAVAAVQNTVTAALARADEIGSEPVGSVTADITTAFSGGSYVDGRYTGGERDDRGKESTLGHLVADSLVASLGADDRGGAEIGVVNPGGLRAELLRGDDGIITYAEANAVLPFVNNLWTTTLTGDQFKQALEQQWQPEGASRSKLALVLSSNVSYTYDDARAAGDRITSVTINGQPLDPQREYRIGSFSFLLQGGDNFTAFAEGANTQDSGLIDRDAWIEYLRANPNLEPDFAKRGIKVTSALPASVSAGEQVAVEASELSLTSLGSPEITSVTPTWQPADGADAVSDTSVPVIDGVASFTTVAPALRTASQLAIGLDQIGALVSLPTVAQAAGVGEPAPGENGQQGGGDSQQDGQHTGADGSGDGQLARTGDDWMLMLLAGLLLAAGAGAAGVARSRRHARR